MTTDLAPPDGRRIAGRYELRSVIGRGGAGTVWRAEDVLLRRPVAVKEVHLPPTLGDEEHRVLRERVMREARSAAAVRHPVLVTVFDVVEDGDRPWIVLELVEARTLAARIAEQPLTPPEAARIGLDLLAGLRAVHRAGIQHRDVKPGNVLLEEDGRPRLTDFGIASTAGDPGLTGTGVLLGSPSYLPPERARGGSGGPESDLWSLAATLYAAVEGQPPYEGTHPLAVLTAVVEGRRRPARRAGPLEPLLADLLDRAPADRPQADEVRERLVAAAGPGLASIMLDVTRSPGVDPHAGPSTDSSPAPDAATDALTATPSESTRTTSVPPLSLTADLDLAADPAGEDEETAATARPGSAGAPGPRGTRRPVLLAVAGMLVVALVATVGLLFRADRTPSTAADDVPGTSASTGRTTLPPAALAATAATAATPPGWVRYTDPAGWSVAHPAGWRQTRLGQRGVDFVEPGTGSYLHVETSPTAPASVLDDWTAQEKLLVPRVSKFARVALTPADGADGRQAADWEFTFDLAGSPLRALDRGLVVAGTGYSLYWQTPADAWGSSVSTLTGLLGSFATS